ncbi:hypothetical protein GIB67_006168 [Kingdonia uniflora]|uniref:GINS subunit domain-containing protein n=1 Tax=Kingdonia uniflora TaxID=39325 RepID=A0A7J7LPS8_9MAGN|nr:hypothetical protein GIB67_006168 [Kingdonia uniflora]
MEEENITSTFKVRASKGAVLDPCAETNTVEQGAKVKLPFWLAQYLRSKEVVTIDVPPCFDKKFYECNVFHHLEKPQKRLGTFSILQLTLHV